VSTSEPEESAPVGDLPGPTGAHGTAFVEPGEGVLNDSAPSKMPEFSWDGVFIGRRLIAPPTMLDVYDVASLVN